MNKLWQPTNKTLYSNAFTVNAGYCAVLFATGLLEDKVRQSAAEFACPQTICVRRLVYDFTKSQLKPCSSCCDYIFDLKGSAAKNAGDELVSTCGSPWALDPERNLAIIGIPGLYRLQLNDATAIGVAQVYVDWYPLDTIPQQVAGTFFA